MSMLKHRDRIAGTIVSLADLFWIFSWIIILGRSLWSNFSWSTAFVLVGPVIIQMFFLAFTGAYRLPRRWGINEAVPVVLRAALPAAGSLLLLGSWLSVTDRIKIELLFQFAVLYLLFILPGLVLIRLLAGRIQLLLYRRGLGLRRSLVVGDGEGADYLFSRIASSDWLGERIINQDLGLQAAGYSNGHNGLMETLEAFQVDVVWLTNDIRDQDIEKLPKQMASKYGRNAIWRILPEQFQLLNERLRARLTTSEQGNLIDTLEHNLSLPEVSISVLGSRGVPANYSGVEESIEQIGSYLSAFGQHIVVYCHKRFISNRGRYKGMDLRFVPTIPTKNLETIVHTILSTLHVLLREEQIVHYHALGPSTLAWLPRIFGRKVIVSVQGLDWQRAKWGRLARIYLKVGEWASAHFPHTTIVVSQTLFDYYKEKYPGINLVLIPNGYERQPAGQVMRLNQLDLEKDNFILFVGRLVPEKGCHLLIEAFGNTYTDKHLVFAGSDNFGSTYRRKLEGAAAAVGNVHFTGFVDGESLAALYCNAYLVVLPSDIEGMSLALLEALSHGNCVLVSDIRENKEVVRDIGVTFQNGNGIDMAQKLQYLFDHPQQVENKRSQARELIATHMEWEEIAMATLDTYKQLIHPK